MFNACRFGYRFEGLVANTEDVVIFAREKAERGVKTEGLASALPDNLINVDDVSFFILNFTLFLPILSTIRLQRVCSRFSLLFYFCCVFSAFCLHCWFPYCLMSFGMAWSLSIVNSLLPDVHPNHAIHHILSQSSLILHLIFLHLPEDMALLPSLELIFIMYSFSSWFMLHCLLFVLLIRLPNVSSHSLYCSEKWAYP